MVCADKVRIRDDSIQKNHSQPSNFLPKIFHSFEGNKYYYGILQTL